MTTLHNDHTTTVDLLGRATLRKLLFQQICKPKELPLVFGVHGDWGAGKSSFLLQLRKELDETTPETEHVVTIWFEAWRYQHETAPVIALLQEVRQQLSTHAKVWDKAKTIGAGVLDGVLTNFGAILKAVSVGAIELDYKGLRGGMEARAQERGEEALTTDRVRHLLEEAIGGVLKTITDKPETNRLVIFIDDLDRCEPDAVFRMLQSIKVYLSLKNCVFVLGINQQAIIEALARHYGAKSEEEFRRYAARASSYIEKICGNVYSLPPPAAVEDIFVNQWVKPLPEVLLGGALDSALKVGGVWVTCLPPNPRRLKMLANSLARAWSRYADSEEWKTSDGNDVHRTRLIRALVCVTYCFQFHHAWFLNWRSAVEAGLQLMDQWLGRSTELSAAGRQKFERDYCLHHPEPRLGHTADESLHVPDRADPGYFWIAPLYRLTQESRSAAPAAPTPAPSAGLGAGPEEVLPPSGAGIGAGTAPGTLSPRVQAFELAFRHVY